MDEGESGRILGKIGVAILAIALVDLGFLNYWVVKNDKLVTNVVTALSARQNDDTKSATDTSKTQAGESEPSLSPTPVSASATEKTSATSDTQKIQTVVQNAQKEIFISLGSSSTKSNSYADLSGLEVSVDPSKYLNIDSIVFEAALWVDGGNGRAWAQLYVVDDTNPLIESQISNPTLTPTIKTSGKIPIPSSTKTYRVQAKTELTDFAAHVDNARIKITLK